MSADPYLAVPAPTTSVFRHAERFYRKKTFSEHCILDCLQPHPRIAAVRTVDLFGHSAQIHTVDGIPGFLYICSALPLATQHSLVHTTLAEYMRPPNACNLDSVYELPPVGLVNSLAKGSAHLLHKPSNTLHTHDTAQLHRLIRKMRWTTLGLQYDWTTKTYPPHGSCPFPADLAALATTLAQAAGFPEFRPEAAIINMYQLTDTLTGHVDRSEQNMDAPLLSISLGSSCVFLLGGTDRDQPVTAIRIRSGDVCILSGPSRRFYHGNHSSSAPTLGVPRILADTLPDGLDHPLIKDARININIRQVF